MIGYVLTQPDMHVCLMPIHEMPAINEITFCLRVTAFSGCEKELNVHALAEKLFQKFQQISATAKESISRK